jgi:hypothetical protein
LFAYQISGAGPLLRSARPKHAMKAIEYIEHVIGLVERAYSTKPLRYVVGAIEFLFAFCVVFVGVELVVMYFFPSPRGEAMALVIGWNWRHLPGALLG